MFKNKKIKAALLCLAALAIAVIAELAYVRLAEPVSADRYERLELAPSDFDSWEFRDEGDDRYYALAYNSYFIKENLGGLPAKTVTVYLERDAGDATECVLYYTADKDGGSGEYVGAMTQTGQGVYTADISCDALYSIKIFPTEKVHSTVKFGGICINDSVELESFSPARLILWVFVVGSLYIVYLFVGAHRGKNPRPSIWAATYMFAQTLLLFACLAAAGMFTAVSGHESLLLVGCFALFGAAYLLAWVICVRISDIALKAAACALVAGVVMSFANAPLQAPDEYIHYLRAYDISCGSFVFDGERQYPDDVDELITLFSGELNNAVNKNGDAGAASRLAQYFEFIKNNERYTGKRHTSAIRILLPYLPAALGMAAARLLGAHALGCLWAGRIVNAALYAAALLYALRRATRWRGAIAAAALLPISIYMASSLSYDSMFLAAAVVFFGGIFCEKPTVRDTVFVAVCFGIMISIKPVYLPLALLVFAKRPEEFGGKIKRSGALALMLGCAVVLYFGSLAYSSLASYNMPDSSGPQYTNVAAQIKYVLTNPVRYAVTVLVDGWMNSFYLFDWGLFGWLDLSCPLAGSLTPAAFTAAAALCGEVPQKGKRRGEPWLCAFVAAAMYLIIITGFYCTWSSLGGTSVLGVQVRYFIPMLPCIFVAISSAFSHLLPAAKEGRALRERVCVYSMSVLALISAAETAVLYYLT